jgi:hypothetical protein
VNYSAGDKEKRLRVQKIGRQIITANPEIGMQPDFAIYGTPKPELFHSGTQLIHITEGLVDLCKTDGQLAAVLAHEMAEMVADREALASPRMRVGNKRPPADVMIGNGIGDRSPLEPRLAELAGYEKQNKLAGKALPLPDPDKLARRYLEKAGHDSGELDAARPLLKAAERTYVLEKQFKQFGGLNTWAPAQSMGDKNKQPPGTTTPTLPPAGAIHLELPPTLDDEPGSPPPPHVGPPTPATTPTWGAKKQGA